MTQEEIKRHRVESVLKEIIPEALATLDDTRINSLLNLFFLPKSRAKR